MAKSDITALTMPKFGMTMKEGTIANWTIAEGAVVTKGDEIANIETEKITNSVEAPATGILKRQVADENETLAVGALIGVIAEEGVSDEDIDDFISRFEPEGA